MTIRPCDFFIACECDESPVRNFSAETPDPNTFFRLRFPNPGPPPIGQTPRWYQKESCIGVCFSDVSQEDADACALRDAELCQMPPGIPQPEDPVLYGNAATSCEYPCPEGPPFVYSIPAGTYLALSQELADLTAQSYCANLAFEFHTCEMPGPPPTPGTPCPAVTGTSPTSPVTLNMGDSTTLEVSLTYAGNPNDLMYVWFQGNIPVAFTMVPTLNLIDVTEADEGDYILGIYAPGCNAVFSPIIQVIVACVAEVPPPVPPVAGMDGVYDYAVRTSIGSFEVQETGNTNGSPAGQNSTALGNLAAGWYDIVWQGGGTEFTDPLSNVFYTADGFGAEFEIGGIPLAIVDYPADFPTYATCALAENVIATPGTSLTGPFQTTASGGGAARVWGAAYQTTGGWSMAKCDGNWPTLEVFNYVFETMPLNVQISHFETFAASLNMCATCQDRVGVEWDGTFTRSVYDPFFLTYQIGSPFSSATISLNGKRISQSSCDIILTESPPGTPVWKLTIKCKNVGQPNGGGSGQIIWSGVKAKGRTPVGVYVSLEEACNPGKNPECCRIEEI